MLLRCMLVYFLEDFMHFMFISIDHEIVFSGLSAANVCASVAIYIQINIDLLPFLNSKCRCIN